MHTHVWRDLLKEALGSYSKRDSQNDAIYLRGMIQNCTCDVLRFVPNEPKLKSVEVTIKKETK